MATFPFSNADTKVRQEVRAESTDEVDETARGQETEVDQIDFDETWAERHNREIWNSKDWRSDASGFYD